MKTLLLALALVARVACADSPDNYAFGVTTTGTADAAFYRVQLPPAVYNGASRADLGDIRVFNADGAAVPFALLTQTTVITTSSPNIDLPIFPLRAQSAAVDLAGLTLTLDRTVAGTSLRVATQDGKPANGDRLIGYVIDATAASPATANAASSPIKSLALAWPPSSGSMTRHLKVDVSDDLIGWHTVVADAAVIDLASEGRRLVRNHVELPAVKAKYLRIIWNAAEPPLEVSSVAAQFADVRTDPPRQWRELPGVAVSGHDGDYDFDAGGSLPVDRVAVVLPEVNSVVPVQLFSRAAPDAAWSLRTSMIAYRLRGADEPLVPGPTEIAATAARYWMLRIDPRSGGLGSGIPRLRVGGPTHEVVFAARGSGPFTIVYGNAAASPAMLPIATLVPGYGTSSAPEIAIAGVEAGPHALGGAGRLSKPVDVRRALLWTVLVLGVAMMAWMAWRLSAQLGSEARDGKAKGDDGATGVSAKDDEGGRVG